MLTTNRQSVNIKIGTNYEISRESSTDVTSIDNQSSISLHKNSVKQKQIQRAHHLRPQIIGDIDMSSASQEVAPRPSHLIKIQRERCSYEWTVTGIANLPTGAGDFIHSPLFQSSNAAVEWSLRMYPEGATRHDGDYVSLYLRLHSCINPKFKLKVQFYLSMPECRTSGSFQHTYRKVERHGTRKFIKRSELLESCGARDAVTIRCDMIIWGYIPREVPVPAPYVDQEVDFTSELSEDLVLLLKKSREPDARLIVEGARFQVHKIVLGFRSPIFFAMFDDEEYAGVPTKEVQIEDLGVDVVKAMLKFIYTGSMTDVEEEAYELLRAADRYGIQRLRSRCEEVLLGALGEGNAVKMLIQADRHHSWKLKRDVMNFIGDQIGDLEEAVGYQELSENWADLCLELRLYVAYRRRPKE